MLQNLIPAFRHKADAEADAMRKDAIAEKAAAPKHGPRGVRYMSAGQVRRMHERAAKSANRKMNRRRRRAYLDDLQLKANARGQRAVLAGDVDCTPAMRQNVVRAAERAYRETQVAQLVEDGMTRREAEQALRAGVAVNEPA